MGSGCCTTRCSVRVVELHKTTSDVSSEINFIPLRRQSKAAIRMQKRQKFMEQYYRRRVQTVKPEIPKTNNNIQSMAEETEH